MISKELLGEVLKADIRKINNSILDGNLYYYKTFVKCKSKINIYELAHKCKEWAFRQGYELRNGRSIDVKEELCYFCEYKQERQLDYYDRDYFLADNESESIFKACQWILESKKEGN